MQHNQHGTTVPVPAARRAPQHQARSTGNGTVNRLLGFLPEDEIDWLWPHLEKVEYRSGDVLTEAHAVYSHVYFPETAVCSIINRLPDGGVVEVGTIGNEGAAGVAVFLGDGIMPNETIVQIPGVIRQAPAALFADGLPDRPHLRRILQRYTHAYLTQVSQTAACNARHPLEARCARWLLMTHDRVGGSESFPLTQQFLAFMLGVRRAGVTEAAGKLERVGLIRNQRGRFTVVDRDGLEEAACGCYGIVRREYERLFGAPGT